MKARSVSLDLTTPQNLALFALSGLIIWYLCTQLSGLVNFIDDQFRLGAALGGTIILSVVTNLPEIAITLSGAAKGDLGLAVGNVLGGISVQTALLVVFDAASGRAAKPLSTLTASPASQLQGLFLLIILGLVIMGKELSPTLIFLRVTPIEALIVATWLLSLLALRRFPVEEPAAAAPNGLTKTTALVLLALISAAVLAFGVLLEATSSALASHFGINGVVFGATLLALVTSLPELSGGLAFVRARTFQPIISDIFGGNAFLPLLLLLASLASGRAVLPDASAVDIYLTATALILTAIYLIGMVVQAPRKRAGLGIDSWAALAVYALSVLGLFFL